MAKFKMKQLALAVSIAAGGMGLIPSVQAVNLATDGLGQVLIFPYYTTRAGWNTLLNITNTSNEVVVAKVRFHEGYNSRDVFDFNVILSPHDVWNGTLSNGPGDVPLFSTSDTTCTVPAIPAGGQLFQGNGANGLLAYTNATGGVQAADGGPTTTDRMREGYVSVIMMGTSPAVGLAANAVHTAARVPANCAALRTAFSTGTPAGLAAIRLAFPNYAVNPLKGAFSLVNAENGWNAGGSAVTLADFYDPTVAGANPNLITAQLPPTQVPFYTDSFHQPELASANTPGEVLAADGTALTSAPAITDGADAVSFVLQRRSVVNQWANLAASATSAWTVASDWVVTFPTKRFYVDTATHEFSGRATAGGTNVNVTRPGLPAAQAPFTNVFAGGRSCDAVGYTIYDREEQQIIRDSGPVFSPAPSPQGNQLCEEVNVLTFNGSNVLGSGPALTGNIADLPGANGWMQLNFLNAASVLPVVGFAVINRTDPNDTLNESFIVNNAYLR